MDNINFDFLKNKAETSEQQQKQEWAAEKGSYSQEYSDVINSSISTDNIYTFHDDALEKLIKIVDRIVEEYKNAQPDTRLSGKELEDEALKEEGLQDIPSMLDIISKRKVDVHKLDELIKSRVVVLPNVFVPPGRGEIMAGSGEGIEEKEIKPRLTTLLYILENDLYFDLQEENGIQIIEGVVTDEMMRKHPYFRVSIPPLERIVYICEEEGNASFVFDKSELDGIDMNVEELDVTNKATYNKIIADHPKIGTRIIQSKSWRSDIVNALVNDFEKKEKKAPKQKSDFEPKEIIQKKKDGWESANSLRKICNSGFTAVYAYAGQFRLEHPEWFESQRTGRVTAEHYHPRLVELVTEHFTTIPRKKDGWESASSLSVRRIASRLFVEDYAEQFRVKNPEWFEEQRNIAEKAEYYHPRLVELVTEHFTTIPRKKDGWESASVLMKICDGKNFNTIKKYAEQFRLEHSGWFEIQRSGTRPGEHYHPDLVAKIIEHFKK